MSEALVLGIESTCDETGAALVRGRELLGDVVATSMDAYARFGGIIPEIASRAHLESFLPTLDAALDRAGVDLDDVDVIAVSAGPGLVGSLTVGISAAKALSACLGRPIYGVNHVIGHLAVDELVDGPLPERFIGLIVSGGHSSLLHVKDVAADVVELGGTLDDAAGEAFDKVGRLLGLPYPGGPHVDRLSQEGNRDAIRFPRGLAAAKDRRRHRYDFSFSGLKTAVARYVDSLQNEGEGIPAADVCAAFSEAVNDSLTSKAVQAPGPRLRHARRRRRLLGQLPVARARRRAVRGRRHRPASAAPPLLHRQRCPDRCSGQRRRARGHRAQPHGLRPRLRNAPGRHCRALSAVISSPRNGRPARTSASRSRTAASLPPPARTAAS